MLYDLIYPQDEEQIDNIPCLVAASYFEEDELLSFGIDPESDELNEVFIEDNEFEKVFKLWDSPLYLRKFFSTNSQFFEQEYWNYISEDEFVCDVVRSLNVIRKDLIRLFKANKLYTVVEPLSPEECDSRLYQSIKVKIKQGWIHKRLAFRFYAIEIEEKKCYLITGAAIKIHKDMMKAPNTEIEMKKLVYASNELSANGIDTKELFIDFIFNN